MKPPELGARSLDAELDRAAIVVECVSREVARGPLVGSNRVIGNHGCPSGDVHGVRSSNRQPSSVKD